MTCPTRDEIANCLIGRLAAWQTEQIFQHVESCSHCQLVVEALDESLDEIAELGCGDLEWIREHATRNLDSACKRMMRHAAKFSTGSRPAKVKSGWELNTSNPAIPDNIRDYQLQYIVGVGGMGTVYSAWHEPLKRNVALKLLSAAHAHSEHAVRHFLSEMAAVGGLNHPHIIRALDAGVCDGVHYLAMELVDGLDVGEVLRRLAKLTVADAAAIASAIANALEYVHGCGLVHRDVKPSNIMLGSDGKALLMDLGLALLTESYACDVGQAHILGSLHYLAPEQAADSRKVDAQADVYGLGCTLYHLLAGQPPFAADPEFSDSELLDAHAKSEPVPLTARCPDVPEGIVTLVRAMLGKSPKHRPSTQQVSTVLAQYAVDADLRLVLRRARQFAQNDHRAHFHSRQIARRPTRTNWNALRLKILVGLLCLLIGIRWSSWPPQERSPQIPTNVLDSGPTPVGKESMEDLASLLKSDSSQPESCLESSTIVAKNERENKTYTIHDRPGSHLRIQITSDSEDGISNLTYQVWDHLELKMKYPEVYDNLAWIWLWKTKPSGHLDKDGWQVSTATVRSMNGGEFRLLDAWSRKAHIQAARNHRGNIALQQQDFEIMFANTINDLHQKFPEAAESLKVLENTLLK